jgi:hypothetical protein
MIELLLLIILFLSSLFFAFLFYTQKKKNIKLIMQIANFIFSQTEEQEKNKTDKEKANEDFLKFVSDSRESAYTYIENFQMSLNKFINDVEPDISYFNKYGLVGSAYPHYDSMKRISEAYKELKKLLPEDYGKIDT